MKPCLLELLCVQSVEHGNYKRTHSGGRGISSFHGGRRLPLIKASSDGDGDVDAFFKNYVDVDAGATGVDGELEKGNDISSKITSRDT